MTEEERERALFAFQTFVLLCEEVGGIDQPSNVLKKLTRTAVSVCNGEELFRRNPINGAELIKALQAGPMLVTLKAQELRRAASAWEAEFPSPRKLHEIIAKLY